MTVASKPKQSSKPYLEDAIAVVERAEEADHFSEPWRAHDERCEVLYTTEKDDTAADVARKQREHYDRYRRSREQADEELDEAVAALLGSSVAFGRRVRNAIAIRRGGLAVGKRRPY